LDENGEENALSDLIQFVIEVATFACEAVVATAAAGELLKNSLSV